MRPYDTQLCLGLHFLFTKLSKYMFKNIICILIAYFLIVGCTSSSGQKSIYDDFAVKLDTTFHSFYAGNNALFLGLLSNKSYLKLSPIVTDSTLFQLEEKYDTVIVSTKFLNEDTVSVTVIIDESQQINIPTIQEEGDWKLLVNDTILSRLVWKESVYRSWVSFYYLQQMEIEKAKFWLKRFDPSNKSYYLLRRDDTKAGIVFITQDARDEYIELLKSIAADGDTTAMRSLGDEYSSWQTGMGYQLPSDYYPGVEAYWYEMAVEHGSIYAIHPLANYYLDLNDSLAVRGCLLYEKYVGYLDQNPRISSDCRAYLEIADLYYYGKGCEQDREKAKMYHQKAFTIGERNIAMAMTLVEGYTDGDFGLPVDKEQAAYWYKMMQTIDDPKRAYLREPMFDPLKKE